MRPYKLVASTVLLCVMAQVNATTMVYNTSNQAVRSDNQVMSYSPKGYLTSVDGVHLIHGGGVFIEQARSMTSTMFGGVRLLSNGVAQSIFTDNHSALKTASADNIQHSYTDPYGNAVVNAKVKTYPLLHNRMTFDGGYQINNDLISFNARSYMPSIKRFTSNDSYDVPNRYNFSAGNPVMKFDPSGHNAKDVFQGILLYGFGVDTRSLEGLGISLAIHVVGGLVPLAIIGIKKLSLALDTGLNFGDDIGFGELTKTMPTWAAPEEEISDGSNSTSFLYGNTDSEGSSLHNGNTDSKSDSFHSDSSDNENQNYIPKEVQENIRFHDFGSMDFNMLLYKIKRKNVTDLIVDIDSTTAKNKLLIENMENTKGRTRNFDLRANIDELKARDSHKHGFIYSNKFYEKLRPNLSFSNERMGWIKEVADTGVNIHINTYGGYHKRSLREAFNEYGINVDKLFNTQYLSYSRGETYKKADWIEKVIVGNDKTKVPMMYDDDKEIIESVRDRGYLAYRAIPLDY